MRGLLCWRATLVFQFAEQGLDGLAHLQQRICDEGARCGESWQVQAQGNKAQPHPRFCRRCLRVRLLQLGTYLYLLPTPLHVFMLPPLFVTSFPLNRGRLPRFCSLSSSSFSAYVELPSFSPIRHSHTIIIFLTSSVQESRSHQAFLPDVIFTCNDAWFLLASGSLPNQS